MDNPPDRINWRQRIWAGGFVAFAFGGAAALTGSLGIFLQLRPPDIGSYEGMVLLGVPLALAGLCVTVALA